MSVRAEVDRTLCSSVAMCLTFAPGAFVLDVESISTFVPDGDWDVEELREAVDGCPMSAIKLIEDDL